MRRFWQKVMLYMATGEFCDLVQRLEYLLVENEILRSKLSERLTITKQERNRLLEYGKRVGAALASLISIVTYSTFQRWVREAEEEMPTPRRAGPGRPSKSEEVRELVLRLARENPTWGYDRIWGELNKLGMAEVCPTTVANILREAGIDPAPLRGRGTWQEFIKRHVETLWAGDFLSKKVWTMGGLTEYFILVWIHIGTRRVIVTGMTAEPDAAWVKTQAESFLNEAAEQGLPATHLIHDRDTKFTAEFDAILETAKVEVVETAPKSPNQNAFCERFILTLKSEALDKFIVFGEAHLEYIVSSFLEHYHTERPHQGVGNVPLTKSEEEPLRIGEIVCKERLGGVLKHYERQAA